MGSDDMLPALAAQEAMWLEQSLAPEAPNSAATVWEVRGRLDVQKLHTALCTALAESPSLLVNFLQAEGGLSIITRNLGEWQPSHLDLSTTPDPAEAAREVVTEQVSRPFDLADDPLFRIGTMRLAEDCHYLWFVFHHIVTDAFGVLSLFSQHVAEIYRALTAGSPLPTGKSVPVEAAGVRERAYTSSERFAASGQFWRDYLARAGQPVRLPTGIQAPAEREGQAGARFWDGLTAPLHVRTYTIAVPASEAAAWRDQAEATDVAFGDMFTAAATAFMHRLCDLPRPLLSFTVNNRSGTVRNALGLLSNVLPLSLQVEADQELVELAQQVRRERRRLLRHAEHNAALIKRAAGHAGDTRSPFGAVVNVIPFLRGLDLGDASGRFAGGTFGIPDEVRIATYADGSTESDLFIRFDAPGSLYSSDDIAGLTERFVAFVRAVLLQPRAKVATLATVAPTDADLLRVSTGPVLEAGSGRVSDMVEHWANRTPQQVAVTYGQTTLTYQQLVARSRHLAQQLVQHECGVGKKVAVAIPPSLQLPVAVLAVLRSGATLVPIDPESSSKHVEFVLSDARPALLMTMAGADSVAITPLEDAQPRWESSTLVGANPISETDQPAPESISGALEPDVSHLLCDVGRTVVVTHGTLLGRLAWLQSEYPLKVTDRLLCQARASSHAAAWELLWPLTAGAGLVLTAGDLQRDPSQLAKVVREAEVTHVHLRPSALVRMLDANEHEAFSGVRRVLCSGAVLTPASVDRFWEATGLSVGYLYRQEEGIPAAWDTGCEPTDAKQVLIGAPTANTSLYVLDRFLKPLPPGAVGELFIAGAGAALENVDRSVDGTKIVASPFGQSECPVYGTGDLARWNTGGLLEYWGRVEERVQVRGQWVTPLQTQTCVATHPGVREAVVVPRQTGHASHDLIAYIVPAATGSIRADADVDFSAGLDVAQLRRWVAERLPEHLIPADVVVLEHLPRTADGQLDREALPQPQKSQPSRLVARTPQEQVLTRIFTQLLGVARIGTNDDFFTLGGDSILAIQVAALARAEGLQLTPRAVFEARTVTALAERVSQRTDLTDHEEPSTLEDSNAPIQLPPMARLFAEQGPGLDNLAQWMILTVPADLKPEQLNAAVQAVLDQHDVLRSQMVDDTLVIAPPGAIQAQQILRQVECGGYWNTPQWRDHLQREASAEIGQIRASAGQMLRLLWFRPTDGGPGRLLVTVHHLVIDGMSWRVLATDLAQAYRRLAAGEPPALPPVGTSMRRWMTELSAEAVRPQRMAELKQWTGMLGQPSAPIGSRTLNPSTDLTADAETVRVELGADLTAELPTTLARAFRCGVDDVLLTALILALSKHQRDSSTGTVIRLERHGRQEDLLPGADLTRTVGWFTTFCPIRFDLEGIDTVAAVQGRAALGAALNRVKQTRQDLPEGGIGYPLLRYFNRDTAEVLRDLPSGEVGFNYLGRFSFERSRPGAEAAWTPAPELPELVAAPDPDMPLNCALELNCLIAEVGNQERLRALFTFAPGLLTREEVDQLAEDWQETLQAFQRLAASGGTGLTPSDVELVHVSQTDIDAWQEHFGRVGDVWPLTPLQRGLLFHAQLQGTAAQSYQTQFVFRLDGPVDASRLQAAAQSLLDRHPNLRVAFPPATDGELRQVVVDDLQVPWRHLDVSHWPEQVTEILADERAQRFDLETAPLLRFTLLTLGPTRAELALTAHHVLFDGWSLPLIEQYLMTSYAGGLDATGPNQGGFRAYLTWQSHQDTDVATAAWSQELASLAQPTLLATALAGESQTRTADQGPSEVGQVGVDLSAAQATDVVRRAATCGVTPNVLVQGAWAVVLAQLTGTSDVVFGTSVAVRPQEVVAVNTLIGMLTNTVPVRVRLCPGESLSQVLGSVQDAQGRMLEHYHVGLGDVQRASGHNALFDTIVLFESFPVDRAALAQAGSSAGLKVTGIRPFAPTHYPLTLIAAADPGLSLTVQYHPEAIDAETAGVLAERLGRVLSCFAADPQTPVAAIDLLSEGERQAVLQDWNATAMAVPRQMASEQFAQQVQLHPQACAVQVGNRQMTYAELDRRSNRMAHWLIGQGIGPESRVVVALPRTCDLVAALLAVWKAGGCYVPVDPQHPPTRTRAVIEDCSASLVWDQNLQESINLAEYPEDAPETQVRSEQAAYTIYTSGSAGRPKGVVITHAALTNFLTGMQQTLQLTSADRLAAVTTVAFDIAALELFLPLTTGAVVVLADHEHVAQPQALLDLVSRAGVTVMQATPALWQMLVDEDFGLLKGVRALTGGEALPPDLAERLCEHAAGVINLYGPTETTIWSTLAHVHTGAAPTIGTPIANTRILILDGALRPVAPGVTGDLWIAGKGLARGYHQQPGLTAERFTADPFGPPGSRMYRTGDLARWSAEGEVQFLGRADFQIKLRGFRIEPGEVEHVLTQHPQVREAVVILREERPGEPQLVGYVITQAGDDLPPHRELQQFLHDQLPDYMVPSVVVSLDQFPLTTNGKLDRAMLPRPEGSSVGYRAPQAELEKQLCHLFEEVLDSDRVGLDDDFFALGGHSLLATRFAARARAETGVEIPIHTLFTARTVAELVGRWDRMMPSVRKPLRKMTER